MLWKSWGAFEKEKESNNNNKKSEKGFFSQISMRFRCDCVCVSAEEKKSEKRQLEKKYPTASRQIDFSQVLSAIRISLFSGPYKPLRAL